MLSTLGGRRFTLLGNCSAGLHFLMKFGARSPLAWIASLAPYSLGAGTYRSAAINAQLMKVALQNGLQPGETAACQANLRALTSMVTNPSTHNS